MCKVTMYMFIPSMYTRLYSNRLAQNDNILDGYITKNSLPRYFTSYQIEMISLDITILLITIDGSTYEKSLHTFGRFIVCVLLCEVCIGGRVTVILKENKMANSYNR